MGAESLILISSANMMMNIVFNFLMSLGQYTNCPLGYILLRYESLGFVSVLFIPVRFDGLCFLDSQMSNCSVLLLAEVQSLEWTTFFAEMTDRGEGTEVRGLNESEIVRAHAIIVEHEYVLVFTDALPTVRGFVSSFFVVII